MPMINGPDGTGIYYRDWGSGQPIVFVHGWPLTGDDWERQMAFFGMNGFRVIAHDRRGHGRSDQPWDGHDMDHYADDLSAVMDVLGLQNAVLVGHSTGGGEVTRYIGRHGTRRVAKAVLLAAVPPVMVQKESNPEGLPLEVFDGYRAQILADRPKLYWDVPIPFYGFNRPGATINEGLRIGWWRQGMMGSLKAHHDGIKAFSETDFSDDLKKFDLPTWIAHGDDDQIVPYHDAALKSAKLVPNAKLTIYEGLPHGLAATHADRFNSDLMAFIRE